jgi:capsular exopolysaccharide synthesis family protein
MLRALRRRWLLALTLVVFLGPLATAAAWYLVPVRHSARALFHVKSIQPALLYPTAEGASQFLNYQRTQLALVKSRLVLNAALKQPGVAHTAILSNQPSPVEWLEQAIKADYSIAPEVLRISLAGDSQEELVLIVNAVSTAYQNEIVDKEVVERNTRLEELKKLLVKYTNSLEGERRSLRELAETVGSSDQKLIAFKHQFAQERLAASRKELLQLQSDMRKAMVEAAALPQADKLPDVIMSESALEERYRHDPVIVQTLGEIAKTEHLINETKQLSARGDAEPSLVGYRARLESAQKALTARKDLLRPQIVKELREKARDELLANAGRAQGRVRILTELEKALKKEVDDMVKETRVINSGALDMAAIQDELAKTEEVTKRLGAKIEALTVEKEAPPRIRQLEEASVNADSQTKRRMALAGGAGLGMVFFALFGLAWLELRVGRISTLADVKVGAGLRLVGTLPTLPAQGRASSAADGRTNGARPSWHLLLESVDATRTVLMHTVRSEGLRAVMVTSALSGEGKTSLSSQLAVSLARVGFKTLLVDGDLRRPMLHDLFGVPVSPGLCELLRGEAGPDDVIRPTPVPGLSLVSVGRFDASVQQALALHRGKDVFQKIKNYYDLVVLDSSPVLPVADSLLLAQYVDGVLFAVLRDVSRMPSLVAACDRVASVGIRVLGAVMAGVHAEGYTGSQAYYQSAYYPQAPAPGPDSRAQVSVETSPS